jgi:hypothetical protein
MTGTVDVDRVIDSRHMAATPPFAGTPDGYWSSRREGLGYVRRDVQEMPAILVPWPTTSVVSLSRRRSCGRVPPTRPPCLSLLTPVSMRATLLGMR